MKMTNVLFSRGRRVVANDNPVGHGIHTERKRLSRRLQLLLAHRFGFNRRTGMGVSLRSQNGDADRIR